MISGRQVNDTTDELLEKNMELLKESSIGVAREMEKGIVSIDTLKKVNADLIATIDQTLKIQGQGREKRSQAEAKLTKIEQELKRPPGLAKIIFSSSKALLYMRMLPPITYKAGKLSASRVLAYILMLRDG